MSKKKVMETKAQEQPKNFTFVVKAPIELELKIVAQDEKSAEEKAIKYLEHVGVAIQQRIALLYKPHITKENG